MEGHITKREDHFQYLEGHFPEMKDQYQHLEGNNPEMEGHFPDMEGNDHDLDKHFPEIEGGFQDAEGNVPEWEKVKPENKTYFHLPVMMRLAGGLRLNSMGQDFVFRITSAIPDHNYQQSIFQNFINYLVVTCYNSSN